MYWYSAITRLSRARYVRVTATKLYGIDDPRARYLFALAELEVLSGNHNLARGRPVQALDFLSGPPLPHIAGMFPKGWVVRWNHDSKMVHRVTVVGDGRHH